MMKLEKPPKKPKIVGDKIFKREECIWRVEKSRVKLVVLAKVCVGR
jgi:hypothetical protein